uniref:Uncharacterized protein n=1 Tax=Arundo donax TaxID=35708 RepID=A0A0A8ZN81_ARUDO
MTSGQISGEERRN